MNVKKTMTVLCALSACLAALAASHKVVIDGPVGTPGDGLLLGNGDLSCSVYQDKDVLVFRFGKVVATDKDEFGRLRFKTATGATYRLAY